VKLNGTGVDVNEFSYAAPKVGSLRVLLVARLLEEKGVVDYVAAARIVKFNHPDSIFSIVGPFDSNPGAISPDAVRRWEKDGIITYLGTSRDVRPRLRDCNLVVLPSYYREGLPKSLLEALAIGRAIVTCDTPGCRETVIDGVNGFLVPPRDPLALAAAIARFGEDRRLLTSMGLAGRHLAEEQFNVCDVNAIMMREMRILPAI
jgi:glycosyltransferase involved in cell wall biosynthesis